MPNLMPVSPGLLDAEPPGADAATSSPVDPGPYILPMAFMPTQARPVRLRARPLGDGIRVPDHQHAWAQVAYTPRGVIQIAVADAAWIVPPSRAIWIPPNVVHSLQVNEPSYLRTLYVHPDVIPAGLDHCRVVEVSPLLRELIAAIDVPEDTLDAPREQLLGGLILDELRRASPLPLEVPLPRDKRLLTLCNAMLVDPARAWTLDQWARYAGASPRTIGRLFRQELNMSFVQWRQHVVLARAIPLASKGYPLARIARELGYRSQSAFSAMFKRTFGRTPSEFFATVPDATSAGTDAHTDD
ncbi:AraC family transcriptional regulator [Pandoraea communis]|uniref:AraC family transcriptional regulator n=2 Tax=Pandoraea communis TaxID=2508297 RepID=A0A5E4WWZ4_9BURK|nr:helix-turn-helix transcriptional regulator [Pandoraea communis]MDM8355742.1 helix-turn-helix transcriptional regulator [Pandoraea communis]VVE29378.1 AraC family transcriptional regulator [Pandoraea communis]